MRHRSSDILAGNPPLTNASSKRPSPLTHAISIAADTGRPAIRAICVDNHPAMVEGLKSHFASEHRIEVVARLNTSTDLIQEVVRLRPHVVLVEVETPGPDAFEVINRLRKSNPDIRVVVLTAHTREVLIAASIAAGACAFFSKCDALEDVVRGIDRVLRPPPAPFLLGPKVCEQCRSSAAAHGHQPQPPAFSLLTPREAEVLRLIGKGLSRTQIAAQLCRSPKTIDGHQERMMKKLGISARADLIRFAIREGLALP